MAVTTVKHPGTILFVDADGERPDEEVDIAKIPEEFQFAETKNGLEPIVKVVKTTTGDVRRISEYGADGQVLRTTVQTRQPPPKNARRKFTTE